MKAAPQKFICWVFTLLLMLNPLGLAFGSTSCTDCKQQLTMNSGAEQTSSHAGMAQGCIEHSPGDCSWSNCLCQGHLPLFRLHEIALWEPLYSLSKVQLAPTPSLYFHFSKPLTHPPQA